LTNEPLFAFPPQEAVSTNKSTLIRHPQEEFFGNFEMGWRTIGTLQSIEDSEVSRARAGQELRGIAELPNILPSH
jgi:hypothetical protein